MSHQKDSGVWPRDAGDGGNVETLYLTPISSPCNLCPGPDFPVVIAGDILVLYFKTLG